MQKIQIENLKGKIDFGIITIREDEFEAILDFFGKHYYTDGNQKYVISEITSNSGDKLWISIVRCIEQGTGEGQRIANDLIHDLDPDWLVLVGICGSIPDKDFSLGDVFLGSRLHDFSLGAVYDNKNPEFGNQGGPMHPEIQRLLSFLKAMDNDLSGWQKNIQLSYPSISLDDHSFYGNKTEIKKLKHLIKERFNSTNNQPRYTTGEVVSSNNLVKSTVLIDTWKQTSRHFRTIEMELAGVYKAARKRHREYPILSIRGISDIVGFKRSDSWTKFACQSAASFTYNLLGLTATKKGLSKPKLSIDTITIKIKHSLDNENLKWISNLIDNSIETIDSNKSLYSDQIQTLTNSFNKIKTTFEIKLEQITSSQDKPYSKYTVATFATEFNLRLKNTLQQLAHMEDSQLPTGQLAVHKQKFREEATSMKKTLKEIISFLEN